MPTERIASPGLVVIAGCVLLTGGFLALGLLPTWREAHRLRGLILERRAAQVRAEEDSRRLQGLTRRATLLALEVRDYSRLVPEKNGLGAFLGQLSHELASAGVQNTAVRALTPTRLGHCQQLPIEVRGTGSYEQIAAFLQRMEALPRMSSVSRLNIEADPVLSGQVSLDLTLSIYNTLNADSKDSD
jgi:Tfp pilus assembly protein PilO